ncbi:MAG: S41 family peptidase [Sedimentisphaerales bacterium]|nr:S41 family peptidase [Sedimentisphaerales bacterium]
MVPQSSRKTVAGRSLTKGGAWRVRLICLALLSLVGVFGLSCLFTGYDCSAQSVWSPDLGTALVASSRTAGAAQPAQQPDVVVTACRLIYRGQFAEASDVLERADDADSRRLTHLQGVLREYEQISRQRATARAEALQEQLKELDKLKASMDLDKIAQTPVESELQDDPNLVQTAREPNEPNTVTEALAVVARAAEFADRAQKASLMSDPFVAKLLQLSVDRSSILEKDGKWIDAYTRYYYWLRAIDPNNEGYADYAEGLLDAASIAASFRDSPCETRKERYEGVEARMFRRAIEALDLHYVNSIDYAKMATAAIKRCATLTEVLTVAFAGGLELDIGDSFKPPEPAEAAAWSAALAGLQDEIEASIEGFGKDEFLEMMDKILALDDATVQLPRRPLIAHFSEAALGTLDPYTVMVWPRQVPDFEQLMMNEFSGIGAEISKPAGLLTVASLLPDTPAYRVGLDAGDVIETVDGVPTKDMSLTCAVQKIKGPRGTSVVLGIRRRGQEQVEEVTIVRDRIVVPTIRGWQRTEGGDWLYLVDEANRVGYVRITSFSEETAGDLEEILRELEADGLNGLILDLRFNTGGLLDSAVKVVDKFIPDGLIVRTQPRASMIPAFEYAHEGGTHPDYPLVILINSGSASASEIVSGALGDPRYERAVLVGDRTHGKGSVQGITPYPGGRAQLKYTMAYYHLPSGQRVKSRDEEEEAGRKDWGVGSDVEIRLNSKETTDVLDLQRDNDVLVQAGRADHSAEIKKHTLEETLRTDPQLAVGLLVVKAKLIEAGTLAAN